MAMPEIINNGRTLHYLCNCYSKGLLDTGRILGYVERWYYGGSEKGFDGIRISGNEFLRLGRVIVGREDAGWYGIFLQSKFYDERLMRIDGMDAIITYATRRELPKDDKVCKHVPEISRMCLSGVSPVNSLDKMPNGIITIAGQNQETVLQSAKEIGISVFER